MKKKTENKNILKNKRILIEVIEIPQKIEVQIEGRYPKDKTIVLSYNTIEDKYGNIEIEDIGRKVFIRRNYRINEINENDKS